jgi:SAM-dependent methyltransferase
MFNRDYFEREFKTEDPWSYRKSASEHKKHLKQIDLIKALVPEPVDILEIGCAEGIHTELMAKTFPRARIVAVDISPTAVARARQLCQAQPNITFIDGDINRLLRENTLPSTVYDVIIQSESLYFFFPGHLLRFRLVGYVKDLLNLLKPGGVFITCNSYSGVTRPVVSIYYGIFKFLSEPVHTSSEKIWYELRGAFWDCELKAYRTRRKIANNSKENRTTGRDVKGKITGNNPEP